MSFETAFIIIWVSAVSLYAVIYLIKLYRYRQKFYEDLGANRIPALDRHRETIGKYHGLTQDTSFARTADFVNLQSVSKDASLNLRFYLAMPSFLVGLGVLGTFIGFSMTLWSIENILSNADPAAGMKQLFASVKAAFLTSVVGMFWSLVFSKYEKWVFNDLEQKIQSLCARWDRQYYKSHNEYVRDVMFSLSVNLEASLKDGIESSFKAITDNIGTLLKAPTEALADQSDSLREQLKDWKTSVNGQIQAIESTTYNVKSFLDQIDDRISLINEHIQSINMEAQAHSQTWTSALKAQASALKQQEKSANKIRDSLGDIPVMFSKLDGMVGALNNVIGLLTKTEAALTQGTKDLGLSVTAINQWAPTTLRQLNDSTHNLVQAVNVLEGAIAKENTELRAAINDLRPIIDDLISDFDDSIEERLRRTNKLLEAYFKEIDKLATSIINAYINTPKL
ncbi:MAG: hypothetical protein ACXWUF_16885 [Methylomagnum sp.]